MGVTIISKPTSKAITQKKLESYEKYNKFIQWGRKNPAKFAEFTFGLELMDYQRYCFMSSWDKMFALWLMTRNGGKALYVNTNIPIPNGNKKIIDIKVGEFVLDKNGNPTKVVNTSDIFLNHDCYKIYFQDGEEIIADKNHLWNVKIGNKIYTTDTLYLFKHYTVNDLYVPNSKLNNYKSNYKKILKVERTLTVPTKCISVENEDNLFLCGNNFTVTHNSTLSSPFIMTKMMLFPNFNSYILSLTASQSQDTFMKMEQIAKKQIESFCGLTDIYLGEIVSTNSHDGFVHSPQGFRCKLYNNSQVTTVSGDEDTCRGKRSNLNLYDESGFISENYIATTKAFTTQDSSFKMGGGIDTNLLPQNIPNQLLFCSSASSVDSYFYSLYKEWAINMFAGSKDHFVADLNCEVVIGATANGKKLNIPLLSREKVEDEIKANSEKANREYYNKFDADGGDKQPIKRAMIIKNSEIRVPLLINTGNKKRKIALAYDPAHDYDNSIISAGEYIYDEQTGWNLYIQNCVGLMEYGKKKHKPMRTPEQIAEIKEMLVNYNGKGFADYENIEYLMIDAGSGGGGNQIADYFMEDWIDSQGIKRRGLIDKIECEQHVSQYPNAVDKLKLVSPKKYRTEMFDDFIELNNLGLIHFTENYDMKGYLNISQESKEEIEEIDEVTNEKKIVHGIEYKKYKLSWDEELALKQIDLAKEELIATRRMGDSINYKYDLPPDKKNKMHDDRCYTFVMLAWHLKNLRRDNIINKKVENNFDVSRAVKFRKPKNYFG